jgi:putative spermidine/putrescine transport system permease protein
MAGEMRHPDDVGVDDGTHEIATDPSLSSRLRRAERRRRRTAVLLVAPLLLYVIILFIAPICLVLIRAVYDPDLSRLASRAASALATWDEHALPNESIFASMATDLEAAQATQSLGTIGKRLNYELPGAKSSVVATVRALGRQRGGPFREAMIAADPIWGDIATWVVIKRATYPVTPFYLLRTLDLRIKQDGGIERLPADDAVFVPVLLRTLGIATFVTLATLAMGYPVAFLLASLSPTPRNLLMILVLLPFFTSLLVRTTAWVVLLQSHGVINDTLIALGAIKYPLQLIFRRTGTLAAMVHIQLPFTLLPIYSVMLSIPSTLVRAAQSLGATPLTAFRRVYLPQTLPGVAAGCLLTFILSLGYYITPALVGGPNDQMVSSFIAQYMNRELNWNLASALGALLLSVTLIIYLLYARVVGIDRVRVG